MTAKNVQAAVSPGLLSTLGQSTQPGQKVVVESSTQKMLRIVALVYLIPVVLFLTGYVCMALLSFSTVVQYTAAVLGFMVGIVIAVLYDRRLRRQGGLTFTIVKLF